MRVILEMQVIQDSLGLLSQILRSNRKGQSTIEFVSTLSFALVFLFLFFQIALNFTNGYLIQFATYQASRAYLVHDTGDEGAGARAESIARDIFESYHDLIKSSLRVEATFGIKPPPLAANPLEAMYVGAYSEWGDIFSLSNVLGGKREMKFKSESFLGREPGRIECLERICNSIDSITGNTTPCESTQDEMYLVTAYDNGC